MSYYYSRHFLFLSLCYLHHWQVQAKRSHFKIPVICLSICPYVLNQSCESLLALFAEVVTCGWRLLQSRDPYLFLYHVLHYSLSWIMLSHLSDLQRTARAKTIFPYLPRAFFPNLKPINPVITCFYCFLIFGERF